MKRLYLFCYLLLPAFFCAGQRGTPTPETFKAEVATKFPTHVDFRPELCANLKTPQGWDVAVAASGLGKPRMLYIVDNRLYLTRRDAGDVLVLSDLQQNGMFAELKTAVAEFKGVHGITHKDGWLYLCNNNELRRYKLLPDGSADENSKQILINDLPSAGQHPNRTIDFGPDGLLYVTVGSECNDCVGDKETATILEIDPATWKRSIFASGLRNTVGMDWHPDTREMWGLDNGCDFRGDNWPPEELNQLVRGSDYGFPYSYGKREIDKTREDPAGSTKEAVTAVSRPSILEFPAHAAPLGFRIFLDGPLKGDGLVCWHGSWNRSSPDGFKVQRIVYKDGKPVKAEDFLSGFLINNKEQRFGRPAGIAISPDGSVYVSDDANGVIYRVKPIKS